MSAEDVVLGHESGMLSGWLSRELSALGWTVVCMDARSCAAALSVRPNKNDRNDARGLAHLLRTGLYREVHIKDEGLVAVQALMRCRGQAVKQLRNLENCIRGTLKAFGIKIPQRVGHERFIMLVGEAIRDIDAVARQSVESLLRVARTLNEEIKSMDRQVMDKAKEEEEVRLLTTVPGVGALTALSFLSSVGDWRRFSRSRDVGAYMGLSSRQYASGDVDRQGHISKCGPAACRHLLYEAAQVLLTRSKKACALRSWGLRLAKKKGMRKACVAVARKLAVIMHRMLVTGEEFNPQGAGGA
jgi:transposase